MLKTNNGTEHYLKDQSSLKIPHIPSVGREEGVAVLIHLLEKVWITEHVRKIMVIILPLSRSK